MPECCEGWETLMYIMSNSIIGRNVIELQRSEVYEERYAVPKKTNIKSLKINTVKSIIKYPFKITDAQVNGKEIALIGETQTLMIHLGTGGYISKIKEMELKTEYPFNELCNVYLKLDDGYYVVFMDCSQTINQQGESSMEVNQNGSHLTVHVCLE